MRTQLVGAVMALLLLSACSESSPEVSDTLSGASSGTCVNQGNSMTLDETCLSGEWPLTVASGTLSCSDDAVVFTADGGATYAVNGMATTLGRGLDIEPIWKPNPSTGFKVNIGPLIDLGLSLC